MALVEVDRDAGSGIVNVVINRPEVLNAIDVPTAREIGEAFASLHDDHAVRCIVLSGAGRAFVAGGDLARFADDFDHADGVVDELLDALHPAVEVLTTHDAPVLASVHGAVAGAGLSLMLACDMVIAAADTRFLLAYDRVGASPDCGGTYFLPRAVGPRKAAELMLLGESWDAQTAERHGLVNRVVPSAALRSETARLAARLAQGPTQAFGAYKRLARASFASELSVHLETERAAFRSLTKTADFRAGVSAFLAKRTPAFTGS